MRLILALAASVLAAPLQAAEFDVQWYLDRPAEREQALRRCRDDHRLADGWACRNAEVAANRAFANKRPAGGAWRGGWKGMDEMDTPEWWTAQPDRWRMLQLACRPGAPPSYTQQFCHLARRT